ncbi:MAG: hypothetical protein KC441_04630 [Anaerolineales bacterium]|nr:hypothetical protein [Anaerolineales bacterium]
MKIDFERSGGFGGLRTAVTINTAALSPEKAQQLQDMVEAASFFELPASLSEAASGADQFYYRLTIASQEREHSVEMSDTAAPEAIRPLLRELTLLARQSRR